jgi:tetratricopeptide (TPR) repeat protein
MPNVRAFRNLLVVWTSWIATIATHAADFDQANQLYEQGKFGEAKAIYERLVTEGTWSANLFYNLGNADFRLGAPGVAALNYERALALVPNHPEAAMNLKLLHDQTGARLPVSTWRDRLFPRSGINLYGPGAAIGFWLVLFSLVAIWTRRRTGSGSLSWLLFLFGTVLVAYGGAGIWQRAPDAAIAIVTARQAEARLAPADRAGRAETLPAGSRVRVVSERGEWVYCVLPGGGFGWLPSPAIERIRLGRT